MVFWLASAAGFVLLWAFQVRLYGLELSLPVVFLVVASPAFGFLKPPYSIVFKSITLSVLVLLFGFVLFFTAMAGGAFTAGGLLLVYLVGLGYLAFVAVYLLVYLKARGPGSDIP